MISLRSRRKLKPSDARHFRCCGPELFVELATVVCSTGVLPQKELHECWQMACVVHAAFPDARRVADIAAGHGLLAWILVLLARTGATPLPRTAIALDVRRPPSALALAGAMAARWPDLADAVHYVVGRVEDVTAAEGSTTLFVAAHACGGLSDKVLLAAADSRNPLAVMPCCLSVRKQAQSLAALAAAAGRPSVPLATTDDIHPFRIAALEALGYETRDAWIQSEVTAFNRIILAKPATARAGRPVRPAGNAIDVDSPAEARLLAQRPSRTWRRFFDVSCWIPDAAAAERWVDELDAALPAAAAHARTISVNGRYTDPVSLAVAYTYRVELASTTAEITKAEALALRRHVHQALEARGAAIR